MSPFPWKTAAARAARAAALAFSAGVAVFPCFALVASLGISAGGAEAAGLSVRGKQKQAAEAERSVLRQKLTDLKREILRTETARTHAADALSESEAAISDASRALRDLAIEQKDTAALLQSLAKQQVELTRQVDNRRKQLAKMLREQYVAGNEDRIRLLLSGDNPNRVNRDLQYMGYVSQAQARLIDELHGALDAVEKNREKVRAADEALDEIAREQAAEKAALENVKARHAAMLAGLSGKLSAQRKQAGNILRDEERLSGLVDKLAKVIQEQRRAEAAEAERRRLQRAEALARAERQRQKQNQAPKDKNTTKPEGRGRIANPDAIDDDVNPALASAAPAPSIGLGSARLTTRNELPEQASVQNGVIAGSFGASRGQLRLPVRGELLARFGSKRGDGPAWKGLFIKAATGAEIRAVAGGQVIFSDWLRGFGNLIIVDHGDQYLTIYGNNEALLKRAGDPVRSGDVIASAGNSGGNEQSGLYFEIRHRGRAFDPLTWVTIR